MRSITRSDGKEIWVDNEDYIWLSGYTWSASGRDGRYSATKVNGKAITIHRLILGAGPGDQVDHIDRDTFKNTRDNLRLCSASDNQHNRKLDVRSSSGYMGVSYHKNSGKWQAYTHLNKKYYCAGYYDTPEEAAVARDELAAKLHGEFASLNSVWYDWVPWTQQFIVT